MLRLLNLLENFSEQVGKNVSYLLLIMTVVSFAIVVLRYVLGTGSIALQESVTYFHAALFILIAGYTLQNNGHVRVDIFYQRMNEKQKALVEIFGSVFLLLPFCVFCFWVSFPYVQRSWEIGEKSADAGGIPAVFLLKTLILALAIILAFQALVEILRNVLIFQGKLQSNANEESEAGL